MPRQPVPELTREQRANLILEILMYLENFQSRIWDRVRPASAVAELLRAIAKNGHAHEFAASWLIQVLRKAPPLWEKIKPYYESPWL